MSSTKHKVSKPEPSNELTTPLFPELAAEVYRKIRKYKRFDQAIWTENKAHFIQQYLQYFVQVTKHGAYIDGFAGPQSYQHLDAWCAALVLRSEPKWLRKFFLCEKSRRGVRALRKLINAQSESRDRKGRRIARSVSVYPGDFNTSVDSILDGQKITQKEATFCLLDQRTFECRWKTLQRLSEYKKPPHRKIELLYFLGVGWLHRALAGILKSDRALLWWGKPNWRDLQKMSSFEIVELVRTRFRDELEYAHVVAYPIFDKNEGDRVMYYMIHASDHDEAPALMVRAHYKAVRSRPSAVQQPFNFDRPSK
jgi:three-Cys-motif partner protein